MDPVLLEIAEMFKKEVQTQLRKKRPSQTYRGQNKPVAGRYPTPISKPNASGNLYKSVNVYWEGEPDQDPSLVLDFEGAPYWYFIDQGRKPNSGRTTGQMKPALREWARIKPLPRFRDERGRFISNEERAFLITRSVAKYGYRGMNFIEKAINRTLTKIEEELGDYYSLYFLNIILGDEEQGQPSLIRR